MRRFYAFRAVDELVTQRGRTPIGEVRHAAPKGAPAIVAMVDAAFHGAGTVQGVEVWRIEKMQVAKVPADQYGKFYTGDRCVGSRALSWPNCSFWSFFVTH